jgi:hypothetical protein
MTGCYQLRDYLCAQSPLRGDAILEFDNNTKTSKQSDSTVFYSMVFWVAIFDHMIYGLK